MTHSERIATAVAETFLPNGCKACKREGLPILLLRKAMVPDPASAFNEPLNGVVPLRANVGLRTLRQGYLYVLLDRKHWQAYEVTPEGHLRRFNPYEPWEGEPVSLPQLCVHENHDLPSSFLTLDTKRYSTALVAFADDPWTSSVLDAYKGGRSPIRRFQILDLKAARDNPASIGLALTHKSPAVGHKVFEYGGSNSGGFESVHGFHSRFSRLYPLTRHLESVEREHSLQNGVLAFVLDDPVGMVQEANTQRLLWVERRQAWRQDPEVSYPLLTSQCLLAIRASHRPRADQKTQDFEPMMVDGGTVFLDPEVERQLLIKQTAEGYDKRLEERYDEKKRARFQANYDRIEARYQAEIDWYSTNYAIACNYKEFGDLERFDYDPDNERSRLDYTNTMTLCLSGGITEAPHAAEEPLGPSEQLWLKWLQDPASPAYRALMLSDRNLLSGLLPSFSSSADTDWKDSVKLYAAVAALVGSKEGGLWLRDPLRSAMAQLLGAVNAAAARLDYRLGVGVQSAIKHLNVAGQSLHNGVHLIELKVRMTVGEYYAVQSKHLRQLQDAASEAMAGRPSLAPSTKVRPIILGGVLSLAVLDPKLASKLIDVSLWVSGSAEELRNSLKAGPSLVAGYTKTGLSSILVVGGILDAHGRELLTGMRVNATQVAGLLHNSLAGLRGAASSSAVLLGIGSLYLLDDTLKKNMVAAEKAIGPKATEAKLALHGVQLGLLGGSIEIAGKMFDEGGRRLASSERLGTKGAAKALSISEAGARWLTRGAMVSAAVGILDGTQAALAARRAAAAGDDGAATYYSASAFSAYVGSGVGMYAAYMRAAFFGPLGWAVLLGLAAYVLLKSAESKESNPLERWARRCYFGNANEVPPVHWNTPAYADAAMTELNAATLGINVDLGIHQAIIYEGPTQSLSIPLYKTTVKFRVEIPGFDPQQSAYFWKLLVHRPKDLRGDQIGTGEIVACGNFYASGLSEEAFEESMDHNMEKPPRRSTTDIDIGNMLTEQSATEDGRTFNVASMTGNAIVSSLLPSENAEIVTLSLTYWPDRDNEHGFATTIKTELT